MYETLAEADQKLTNSCILYEGNPVKVIGTAGENGRDQVKLSFVPLPIPRSRPISSTDLVTRKIIDPGFDFRSLGSKLGYVNIPKSPFNSCREAVFVVRVPTRSSRQGLDRRTTQVLQMGTHTCQYEWDTLAGEQGLVDCIHNRYPTVKEAIKLLTDDPINCKAVAINKKLMMIFDRVNPPNLVYRNEKIGYTEDGERFKLAPHKRFLSEELTDMLYFKIV